MLLWIFKLHEGLFLALILHVPHLHWSWEHCSLLQLVTELLQNVAVCCRVPVEAALLPCRQLQSPAAVLQCHTLTCRTSELAVVVFWLSFTTAEIWLTEINVRIDKYPYALLITFDLKNVFNVTKFCLTINSSPFTKLTLSMSEATFHLLMKCQMNMAFGFMTPPMTSQGRWAAAWCQCDCVEEAEWGYHGDEVTGACHHYTLSIPGHRWTTDSWTILAHYTDQVLAVCTLWCAHILMNYTHREHAQHWPVPYLVT